jgi:hypothetical protein
VRATVDAGRQADKRPTRATSMRDVERARFARPHLILEPHKQGALARESSVRRSFSGVLARPGNSFSIRPSGPAARTSVQALYLARYEDVLAATKNIHAFQARGAADQRDPRAAARTSPPHHQLGDRPAPHRPGRALRSRDMRAPARRPARAGGGDLVAEYVTPIPASVIAHLLGAGPRRSATARRIAGPAYDGRRC